jgi:GNAT superfamily N-acetyltransferase
MAPDVTVRRATADDADVLVDLCEQHARFERMPYERRDKAARLRDALSLVPQRMHVWIATSGDEVIGYASAALEYSTWTACEYLHMDCLFVRDGRRGDGVGAALFENVIAHARDAGLAEVQWQTPIWNTDAARFYARRGANGSEKIRYALRIG